MSNANIARILRIVLCAIALSASSACTVGPKYVRPVAEVPDAYKENRDWKIAQPMDDALRGKWWQMFNDPVLDSLQEQVEVSNQNLAQAEAQFRQARALIQVARAGYFPTVTAGVSFTRSAPSTTRGNQVVPASGPTNSYSANLDASWEPDLWGRVRRTVEANQASAQASAGDLQNLRLSLHSDLAVAYFQVRALDTQRQLLDDTVGAFSKTLELVNNRYRAGVVSKADLAQAQTQLSTTRAQLVDIGMQRAQLEHAIALLIGKPASDFSLPAGRLAETPPPIPVGVPSQILERRPDIASAERRVAAANAQIGVAQSAYFPATTLSASAGFQSSSLARWISWPSYLWSIGPAIAQTVFDGGLRRAQTEQARAAYDATVAGYRQAVLNSFKEVEDNLAALRILEEEAGIQNEAVKSSQESVALLTNQYKAGLVSYTDVVSVYSNALALQRTAVDLTNRRMAAAVQLVKALGGGWNTSDLPGAEDLARNDGVGGGLALPVGTGAEVERSYRRRSAE